MDARTGGNGNGNSGDLSNASHGDGDGDGEDDDHDGKNKLGKLNAANAAEAAFIHANADSTVGRIAIYRQRVRDGLEDEPAEGAITTFEDAKTFLETFANKLVTEGVVATLNELLGLASFEEESEDPDPEE